MRSLYIRTGLILGALVLSATAHAQSNVTCYSCDAPGPDGACMPLEFNLENEDYTGPAEAFCEDQELFDNEGDCSTECNTCGNGVADPGETISNCNVINGGDCDSFDCHSCDAPGPQSACMSLQFDTCVEEIDMDGDSFGIEEFCEQGGYYVSSNDCSNECDTCGNGDSSPDKNRFICPEECFEFSCYSCITPGPDGMCMPEMFDSCADAEGMPPSEYCEENGLYADEESCSELNECNTCGNLEFDPGESRSNCDEINGGDCFEIMCTTCEQFDPDDEPFCFPEMLDSCEYEIGIGDRESGDFDQNAFCVSQGYDDEEDLNPSAPSNPPACSDGLDNDGDGYADREDAGCYPDDSYCPDCMDLCRANPDNCSIDYDPLDDNEVHPCEIQTSGFFQGIRNFFASLLGSILGFEVASTPPCPAFLVGKCGDNVIQAPNKNNIDEQCDDGVDNNSAFKACDSGCQHTFCGDGFIQKPNGKGLAPSSPGFIEECDFKRDGLTKCTTSCTLTFCGDGTKQRPNGRDGEMEECDDGANGSDRDKCTDQCTHTFCGDGIIQSPNGKDGLNEKCDNGNDNGTAGNTCTKDCKINPICGNKKPEPGEECDFNQKACSANPEIACTNDSDCAFAGKCETLEKLGLCNTECKKTPTCGNKKPEPGEECDYAIKRCSGRTALECSSNIDCQGLGECKTSEELGICSKQCKDTTPPKPCQTDDDCKTGTTSSNSCGFIDVCKNNKCDFIQNPNPSPQCKCSSPQQKNCQLDGSKDAVCCGLNAVCQRLIDHRCVAKATREFNECVNESCGSAPFPSLLVPNPSGDNFADAQTCIKNCRELPVLGLNFKLKLCDTGNIRCASPGSPPVNGGPGSGGGGGGGGASADLCGLLPGCAAEICRGNLFVCNSGDQCEHTVCNSGNGQCTEQPYPAIVLNPECNQSGGGGAGGGSGGGTGGDGDPSASPATGSNGSANSNSSVVFSGGSSQSVKSAPPDRSAGSSESSEQRSSIVFSSFDSESSGSAFSRESSESTASSTSSASSFSIAFSFPSSPTSEASETSESSASSISFASFDSQSSISSIASIASESSSPLFAAAPECGDGIIQEELGEDCDEGPGNTPPGTPGGVCSCDPLDDNCTTELPVIWQACRWPLCGDGIVNNEMLLNGEEVNYDLIHEECDDGNNLNGDGCSSGCKLEEAESSSSLISSISSEDSSESSISSIVSVASSSESSDNRIPEDRTHTICVDEQCIQVVGEGEDECNEALDCGTATHLVCQNDACVEVEGPGANECNLNRGIDCGERSVCINFACTVVEGGGPSKCTSVSDCFRDKPEPPDRDIKIVRVIEDPETAPPPACGNGFRERFEDCDDGNRANGDGCSALCAREPNVERLCGNGIIEKGEECDDGNIFGGDGCNRSCRVELRRRIVASSVLCGNGVLEQGEECDDKNSIEGDGCSAQCRLEVGRCGDDIVQTLLGEQCETASHNPRLPYRCVDCRFISNTCGDGNIDSGEECDDGAENSDAPDAVCRQDCSFGRCGDGIIDSYEQCDDGNSRNGDGCSSVCLRESLIAKKDFRPDVTFDTAFDNQLDLFFPQDPSTQPVPFELPLARLQPLIQTQGPAGDTGPAAAAVIGAGAAAGFSWMRRKRRK